jgi:lipid-A-disaccharide synthase-like uncharacterized protein
MLQELLGKLDLWFVLVGLPAQAAFTGRFLVQWIASERAGRSIVPVAFWYLSLAGGLGLLAYAIARADPLFILAYCLNSLIYTRNLMLIWRQRRTAAASDAAG